MRSSYRQQDVTLLLTDISGRVQPLDTAEREARIQSGTHYSEMLPVEYVPTQQYIQAFEQALILEADRTAAAVRVCGDRLYTQKGREIVLVSLARAGIPVGILLRWYLRREYGIDAPHYAISIIRGRGMDHNAMQFILSRHPASAIQFVDGWIGKGSILTELNQALMAYPGVSHQLAVLSDPAGLTELCGTHEDFLIPNACLNSTVSGLISRTFLRDDLIGANDFHGAVYYEQWKSVDRSYEFLNAIAARLDTAPTFADCALCGSSADEIACIADHFGVTDYHLIKPGIGEATRVLLRRLPWKLLVRTGMEHSQELAHLYQLASEKGVSVESYPLSHYKACSIICKLADA